MNTKLIFSTPLTLISNATRYPHNNHNKSDSSDLQIIGEKDLDLIKRVAFGRNHSSVLEHSMITFDIKGSTKFLLELSRHRIGVSMTVRSSRYSLRKSEIEYEKTGLDIIDQTMSDYYDKINELLKDKSIPLDKIAMMLPQSYLYNLQLTFNIRSLVNFFKLRMNKSAHSSIRKIAYDMFTVLPKEYHDLLFSDKVIKKLILGN